MGLGYGRWGWEPIVEPLARALSRARLRQPRLRRERRPARPVHRRADGRRRARRAGRGRRRARARPRREPRRRRRAGARAAARRPRRPARPRRDDVRRSTNMHPIPAPTLAADGRGAGARPRGRAAPLRRERARAGGRAVRSSSGSSAIRTANPPDPAGWAAQAGIWASFDVWDELPAVTAPTLVVHGEGDVVVDAAQRALLAERIPGAELRLVPGGHLFFWNRPAAVRRAPARSSSDDDERAAHDRPLDPRPGAARRPTRVAIDYDGRPRHATASSTRRSDAFAAAFAEAGLRRGDRVATLTGNSPEHVAVLFACAKAGLMLLPLSWRLTARRAPLPARRRRAVRSSSSRTSTPAWPRRPAGPSSGWRPRPAATGGGRRPPSRTTTGSSWSTPRARPGSRRARCSRTRTASGRTSPSTSASGVHADDVVLQVLPQFHVGGWNVQALLAWLKGATVVLEREFEPERVLRLIEEKRVTTMMGVPPIYLFLAQQPRFADADLSSLERAVVGGAPMPEALLETWAARGTAVIQGYGLTEAAPNVLCLPPEDAVRKIGFAGKPYPFVEVRLSDEERAAGARAERLRRLLAEPGGDRGGLHRRRLAAHRRHRRVRRRGLLSDQGPPEGHVHLRRRERLSGRGRGGPPRASGGP